MTRCVLLGLAAGLALAADAPRQDAKAQLERLQGTWSVVSVEEGGKRLPAEKTEGWSLTIEGSKYTFRHGDGSVRGVYKLDPLKNPGAIDATRTGGADVGKTLWGIYALKGGEFRLCVKLVGKERPTEFAAAEGSNTVLAVFERVKP